MTHNHELPPGGQPKGSFLEGAPGGAADARTTNLIGDDGPRTKSRSDATASRRVPAPRTNASVGRPFEFEVRGLVVSIRAVTREDEAAIFEFLSSLSLDSRRLRFFTTSVDLRAEAHRGAARDDADHHGVLAIAPERGVVGHAIYVRVPGSDRAEVAVEVADDLHRMGLATALLVGLARVAEARQIRRFFAEVLPENRDMLTIFCDGFAAETIARRDEVDVEFPTSNWPGAQAGFRR